MRPTADGEALAEGIAAVKVGLGVGSVDHRTRKSAGTVAIAESATASKMCGIAPGVGSVPTGTAGELQVLSPSSGW